MDEGVPASRAGFRARGALSGAAMRNSRQSLKSAVDYDAIGILVAAGVLYPVPGLWLSPVAATPVVALSSVSVIDQPDQPYPSGS